MGYQYVSLPTTLRAVIDLNSSVSARAAALATTIADTSLRKGLILADKISPPLIASRAMRWVRLWLCWVEEYPWTAIKSRGGRPSATALKSTSRMIILRVYYLSLLFDLLLLLLHLLVRRIISFAADLELSALLTRSRLYIGCYNYALCPPSLVPLDQAVSATIFNLLFDSHLTVSRLRQKWSSEVGFIAN